MRTLTLTLRTLTLTLVLTLTQHLCNEVLSRHFGFGVLNRPNSIRQLMEKLASHALPAERVEDLVTLTLTLTLPLTLTLIPTLTLTLTLTRARPSTCCYSRPTT